MRNVERSGGSGGSGGSSGSGGGGGSSSFGASEEELETYLMRRIPIAQGLNACIAEILP